VSAAVLDHGWLVAHLPHQGAMNLLDTIVEWDRASIVARAVSHRSPGNPLRRGDELPAACGIEYAAQAVAAHGALLSEGEAPAAAGLLASARGVRLHVRRLDDLDAPLDIRAEQLGASAGGLLYRFEVAAAGRMLVEGRLAIAFDPELQPPR
jgi:predicted hotdog family 3-hydroxylacyl-ACP dehydratase